MGFLRAVCLTVSQDAKVLSINQIIACSFDAVGYAFTSGEAANEKLDI